MLLAACCFIFYVQDSWFLFLGDAWVRIMVKNMLSLQECLQMASILALVNDRISALEGKVAQQQEAIMHLEYKLDDAQGKASKVPYLSGRFGYGLGRPAVHRQIFLCAKRAQATKERDEWPATFLGKFRTDMAGLSLLTSDDVLRDLL
jgi:hypothetical protein